MRGHYIPLFNCDFMTVNYVHRNIGFTEIENNVKLAHIFLLFVPKLFFRVFIYRISYGVNLITVMKYSRAVHYENMSI